MSKIIKSTQATRTAFTAYECGALGAVVTEAVFEDTAVAVADEEATVFDKDDSERRLEEFYAEGFQRGLEQAKSEFTQATAGAIEALRQTGQAMQQAREEFLTSTEAQVLKLVQAITQRILDREARLDPQIAVTMVRRALENLTERERLAVLLNPRDLQALRDLGLDPLAGIEGLEHVEVNAAPSVGTGGCLVESEHVRVDARLDQQLERILEALTD